MIFVLIGLAYGLEVSLGIGSECSSDGGFSVKSFSVNPYPPAYCAQQIITMNGVFTTQVCPNQIQVREEYNAERSYVQILKQSGCFSANQTKEYYFAVNPFQCVKGNYIFQVALVQLDPPLNISCWQYEYTLK